MDAVRRSVVLLAAFFFCALWLTAAWAKLDAPLESYELVALTVGGGMGAKLLLTAVIFGEALLGVGMLFGVVRGLCPSLIGLLLLTGGLMVAESRTGGEVPCGCLPNVLDATVAEAVVRNAIAAGLLGGIVLWDAIVRRASASSGTSDPELTTKAQRHKGP